jgi:methylated-DNA-[protein]-cysteine S-methyltransferase
MAVLHRQRVLKRLAFMHSDPEAAVQALDAGPADVVHPDSWENELIERLQGYASGQPDDFADLRVDTGATTPFQRRVYRACRAIPYGETLSYGRLASLAGSPGAARAVGNCMARNPVPLVVPCHRVIGGNGALGGFGAPGGTTLKRRLLNLEARHVCAMS